jgi:hypothetical protein
MSKDIFYACRCGVTYCLCYIRKNTHSFYKTRTAFRKAGGRISYCPSCSKNKHRFVVYLYPFDEGMEIRHNGLLYLKGTWKILGIEYREFIEMYRKA